MSEFSAWYNTIPQFTKYWFSGTIALTLLGRFEIISLEYLALLPPLIIKKFQIWRIFTALFAYPLTPQTGFHFMFNCYFLYNYSKRLEEGQFKNTPADYLFLLIFNWAGCVLTGMAMNFYFLMDPMVLSVLYVWCQLNKEVVVNFWFGTRFKAMYLPWVLLAFNFVLSSGSVYSLAGILVGHLYVFLKYKYPEELGGPSYIETPSLLKRYFPDLRGGIQFGFGVPPVNRQPVQEQQRPPLFRGNNWGRGQVLGRD